MKEKLLSIQEEEFLKEKHSCRDIKEAFKEGFLHTNGVGCFIERDDYSTPIFCCPFCGKKIHKD